MNATLVRNILPLMILGFVLVIGFQATALEATASSFSSAADCTHDCVLAQKECRDLCDDNLERYSQEWYECRDDCIDEFDQCTLDCGS